MTGTPKNPFVREFLTSEELRPLGFRHVGRNVSIARDCTIHGLGNIAIGNNVKIDQNVTLIAMRGRVTIGSFVHIGCDCFLGGAHGITLADFTGLSQGVKIYSATDDYVGPYLTNPTVPKEFCREIGGPVVLEKHVIVGAGSVILPGVTVRTGCSVGALSVVRKTTKEWGVYHGNPAKKILDRDRGILDQEARLRAVHPDMFED